MLSTLYWQYSQALPWVLGLLVIAGLLLMWWYPPQLRHLPMGWRLTMPALRWLAVGAIALSMLRPVVSRPPTDRERGPVLWLIDNSRSMGVIDSTRPVGQWVGIAAAMGRLPGQPRDANTQAMQADCDRLSALADDVARARSELDYARLSGRSVDAAQSRLDQSTADLQGTARSAIAKAVILVRRGALEKTLAYLVNIPAGTDKQAWLDRLRDKARAAASEAEQVRVANDALLYESDPTVQDACAPLQAMSRLQLTEAAILDGDSGLVSRVGTEIPAVLLGIGDRLTPIAQNAAQAMGNTAPLQADGNISNLTGGIRSALQLQGDSPIRAVVLFSDGRQIEGDSAAGPFTGVPVFTVAAASRSALKDVSIVDVAVPISAYAGETITVRAAVRGSGVNGQSTNVTLSDGQTRLVQRVTFVDDRPVPIEFKWTAGHGGAVRLMIEAGALADEASIENNRLIRWVKVFDRKMRVAIAAPKAAQDAELARQSLLQAVWAESAAADSLSPEKIGQLDVLMLDGIEPNSFDADQWTAIGKMVNERGGSVILVAGDDGVFGADPLEKLLPFSLPGFNGWRTWPGHRLGFHLGPAPGVHALELVGSGDSDWESLPPISRYVPIMPLKSGVHPVLVETESGTPVLTEQRLGRGRVFCFGATETLRWRGNGVEEQRFWPQLFRYAAGEPYESTDRGLSLDSDAIETVPHRTVPLRAKISTGPHDPQAVRLQITAAGSVVLERTMTMVQPKGAGRFETALTDLPQGDYEIQADGGAGLGHPRIPLHVHPSFEAEMADLSGDESWLRRLADTSGGQFFRLDQLDLLAKRLRELPVVSARRIESPLWDGPYLFVLVLGCLATEWGLRKRFGLA
jgi:hypothetical protein